MHLVAATFLTFDTARATRRSAMAHLALLTFDAQLDTEHGGAMMVFRVRMGDLGALYDEIAAGKGTVVYERALDVRKVA
ncbi:MAG: hypothetical protein ACLQBX_05445 [Candidatus Limnocylindrales bacterium]